MDNFLDSVTSKGRKVKERLKGKKGKKEKAGANTAEEGISSSSSFLRPVPHTAVAGHDGEGSTASANTPQDHSRDRSPQPESVPVGGKEADVGENVMGQSHSCLEANVETVVGGGPGPTEVRPSVPSPSTPILHGGKPESTWTRLFHLLYLIVPSDDTEPSSAPDQVPEAIGTGESAKPGPAATDDKSNWGSTAVATAKLLLRGVRDSADAFGPLKSVAGGLCFVLENCEVRSSAPIRHQRYLQIYQRTKANTQTIESLAPRVKVLAELLCGPAPEGDVYEEVRRKGLEL